MRLTIQVAYICLTMLETLRLGFCYVNHIQAYQSIWMRGHDKILPCRWRSLLLFSLCHEGRPFLCSQGAKTHAGSACDDSSRRTDITSLGAVISGECSGEIRWHAGTYIEAWRYNERHLPPRKPYLSPIIPVSRTNTHNRLPKVIDSRDTKKEKRE